MIGKNSIRLYLYLNSLRKFESYGALALELDTTIVILIDSIKLSGQYCGAV